MQGYLTENGYVNLERVEMIMQAVGVAEDNIFRKRKEDDVRLDCTLLSMQRELRVWSDHGSEDEWDVCEAVTDSFFLVGKLQEKNEGETQEDESE